MKRNTSFLKILILFTIISLAACKKEITEDSPAPEPPPTEETKYALGYTGDDNVSKVPTTPNFGYGAGNLPSQVDLISKFPPIGDQQQYGTCVTWAVAYNLKTALNAMDKNLSAGQLTASAYQFSPLSILIMLFSFRHT
ncbi:MAG: hypothetical protein WKG06_28245 [Segetibacter sp.]